MPTKVRASCSRKKTDCLEPGQHLDPFRVNEVLSKFPLACQGRLVVSTDLQQVLAKRQTGLKDRVVRHTRKVEVHASQVLCLPVPFCSVVHLILLVAKSAADKNHASEERRMQF